MAAPMGTVHEADQRRAHTAERGSGEVLQVETANVSSMLGEAKEAIMARRKAPIQLLDTVALRHDLPQRKLKRGEVGTVVEILEPDVYEVEFSDDEGQTYAELALRGDQLVVLHNRGEPLRIVA